MKYDELVIAASKGELSADNINEIILAINDKNVSRDKKEIEQDQKLAKHERGFRDIEEEYPLLPPEADDIAKAVQKKGVQVMCGKKSNAYADKDLRQRVYKDIYGELKREYGLINKRGGQMSYKKLKRKYFQNALVTIDEYTLPSALEEEITSINDLGDIV